MRCYVSLSDMTCSCFHDFFVMSLYIYSNGSRLEVIVGFTFDISMCLKTHDDVTDNGIMKYSRENK